MSDVTQSVDFNDAQFSDYFALLKPRVMSLVVFTAAVGLFVAPVYTHPFIGFASILFIALGGGASGALNMWYDQDIDGVMKRTKSRPIPAGKIKGGEALSFGVWLSCISVIMLGLSSNFFAAGILAFTIFFYAVIYTIWLKRLTPQNIVVGGAAGAFPPMIGWAVATGSVSIESFMMFLLIFMWTPPHFWALALFMNDDYTKAGVPMLTVTHGKSKTRKHILIYCIILAPVAVGLSFTSIGGMIYFLAALMLNIRFLYGAWGLYRRKESAAEQDHYLSERRYFKESLIYLFLHFVALALQSVWLKIGMEAWL
jgi:protoheme IX farnesyltransferase